MIGNHCIKTWSRTQTTLALSSGESELLSIVRAACEGLGMASLLQDLGEVATVRLHGAASAALGIIQRTGVGKIRHLDTNVLWLQQRELHKSIEFMKVLGTRNPADLMTKHLDKESGERHLERLHFAFLDGRTSMATNLR